MNRYKLFLGIVAVAIILLIIVDLLLYFHADLFLQLPNHQPFKDVWMGVTDKGESHRELVKHILERTQTVLGRRGIDMVAILGTLLGVARHEGLIPWDDNLDFAIDAKKVPTLLSMKDELAQSNLGITRYSPGLIKIFDLDQPLLPGLDWSWPFIDVFSYKDRGEHVRIAHQGPKSCFGPVCKFLTEDDYKFLVKDFFPFRTNLFEGIPVTIPNNLDNILTNIYGKNWEDICVSSSYDHSKERGKVGGKKVLCKSLGENVDNILENTWVINLDRREDRWNQTNKRLNSLGISASRWAATDKDSPSFLSMYKTLATDRSKGEIACWQSHLKLWKHLYASGVQSAVIFEDDLSIPPALTLEQVQETIEDSAGFNVLLLGYCGVPLLHRAKFGTSRVGRAQCTHSYAVSRTGLKKLLDANHDFTMAVDEWLYNFCKDNLCYYAQHLPDHRKNLFGRGLFHQDMSSPSDIQKIR
jgi:hypothetical protein